MIWVGLVFLVDVLLKLNAGWFYHANLLLHPLVLLVLVFSLVLVWLGVKSRVVPLIAATALSLGVASNLIDQLRVGYVIDYLPIGPFVYNLADFLILGGALVAAYALVAKLLRQRS